MTVVIAIFLLMAVPMIIQYFNNPLIRNLLYFVIYSWASLMINSLSNACIVYGRVNKLLYFSLAQSIIILLILVMAKMMSLSFRVYMYFYMASLSGFAIVGILWIRKFSGKINFNLNIKVIQEIFKFSIPIGMASVVGTINVQLDKFVIGRFFSTEQYAIFTNASRELPVTLVATSLTAVLLHHVKLLNKENKKEAVELWGYAANIFVSGWWFFSFCS